MPNPYVNKVVTSNGNTLVDLSQDTVTEASHIMAGRVGHLASGAQVTGTGQGGSSATLVSKNIIANGTYDPANDNADGYSSVTVNVQSGGSATQHVIHFEFTDNTNTDVSVYYNDANFSSVITSSRPTTYNSKTVETAQLDGVQWYIREVWETVYDDDTVNANADDPYALFWISSLADVIIPAGTVWRITLNGTAYRCTATFVSSLNTAVIGASDGVTEEEWTNEIPFRFYNAGWGAWIGDTNLGAGTHQLKVERLVTT